MDCTAVHAMDNLALVSARHCLLFSPQLEAGILKRTLFSFVLKMCKLQYYYKSFNRKV